MLARMLGRHPEIAFLKESQFFDDIFPISQLGDQVGVKLANKLAKRIVSRSAVREKDRISFELEGPSVMTRAATTGKLSAADVYLTAMSWLARRQGKNAFVEHTPRNVYYAKEIHKFYADAIFLGLVRDARGVVASQKRRWRQRSLGAHRISLLETVRLRANYHPFTACCLWNRAVDCLLAWGKQGSFDKLRYEDLLVEPRKTLEPLLNRWGYQYRSDMEMVPLWGSSHEPHAKEKGLTSELGDRWKKVLTANERDVVLTRCGDRLQKLGYVDRVQLAPETRFHGYASYLLHCIAVVALSPRRALIQCKSKLPALR